MSLIPTLAQFALVFPPGTDLTLDSLAAGVLLFFFTRVTGPRRFLRHKLSDTRVYEPQIRARLGTTAHFCKVVVLKLAGVLHGRVGRFIGGGDGGGDLRAIQKSMSLKYEPASEPLHRRIIREGGTCNQWWTWWRRPSRCLSSRASPSIRSPTAIGSRPHYLLPPPLRLVSAIVYYLQGGLHAMV